jgi:acetyl-CoA carboxylase biotin carboxyl carrier protein
MKFEQLVELIQTVSSSNLGEFKYEEGDFKISLKKEKGEVRLAEQSESVSDNVLEQPRESVKSREGNVIKSPLVGTFYASPAEDADPFVQVGEQVQKGKILAIVEAMKLMNEIESDYDGVVTDILVDNEQMVEYGQPMFVIKPV